MPAGSVAIANEQTVVYPYAISGGWNVSLKAVQPNFGRFNPISGLGRLFAKQHLIDVAKMLRRHLDNILTYMRHQITNAMMEGFNSKIQTINAKK